MLRTVYEITPTDIVHPGVRGFYPFTFEADIHNTGDRLQAVANITGMTVCAAELMGQDGEPIYNQDPADALAPGRRFADTCKRYSEDFMSHPRLNEFEGSYIGLGHSLGGILISGMQLHGEQQPFSVTEFCDAFNLRAPEQPIAYGRFALYQAADWIQSTIAKRTRATEPLPRYDASNYPEAAKLLPPHTVIRAIGPLMRSTVARDNVLALAADASQPVHLIGYTHGLSGNANQITDFLDAAEDTRRSARATAPTPHAGLRTTLEDKWHSALLDPIGVAANIERTRQLLPQGQQS